MRHDLKKKNKLGYEDLMRELAMIEQGLLTEDRSTAMALMVLEAKIRERFQQMEYRLIETDPTYFGAGTDGDEISLEEIQDMIPHDFPEFPSLAELEKTTKRKKTLETVGMAALLAVATAMGVFGLASVLHLILSWLA